MKTEKRKIPALRHNDVWLIKYEDRFYLVLFIERPEGFRGQESLVRSRHHHGDILALGEELARANMRYLLSHIPEKRDYSSYTTSIVTHDRKQQIFNDFEFIERLEVL